MSVSTYDAVAGRSSAGTRAAVRASAISFVAAVLMLLAGMVWGLIMAISQDHAAMPAHAHLNLVGWVCLFMFGMFYQLHPGLDRARIARVQVVVWIVGAIGMATGVGLIHTGHTEAEPLVAGASMLVFADTLLFAWLLMRREHYR